MFDCLQSALSNTWELTSLTTALAHMEEFFDGGFSKYSLACTIQTPESGSSQAIFSKWRWLQTWRYLCSSESPPAACHAAPAHAEAYRMSWSPGKNSATSTTWKPFCRSRTAAAQPMIPAPKMIIGRWRNGVLSDERISLPELISEDNQR